MAKKFNDCLLFYVVDGRYANEELFTSRDEAEEYGRALEIAGEKPRIRICEVKNAYWDEELEAWNYEDYSDTFKDVITLSWHTN